MPRGEPKKDVASATKARKTNGNGANLGFEAQLFLAPTSYVRTWNRPTTSTSRSAIRYCDGAQASDAHPALVVRFAVAVTKLSDFCCPN